MPRKPIDYSRTVIYKIEHNENKELVYVGSTTDFTKRKCNHKYNCNNVNSNEYNLKVYQMIRENGGFDKFQMLEIKKFPCLDGNECRAEEERCRIEIKANLNSRKAVFIGTKEEYFKQYNLENAEKRKKYFKQYNLENAEKKKEYRLENSEKKKEYNKKYRQTKKELNMVS